jgi:cellulose 1,4-beta-cellobiosidase
MMSTQLQFSFAVHDFMIFTISFFFNLVSLIMPSSSISVALLLIGAISAQEVGQQKQEYHPPMSLSTCTKTGGCQKAQKSMTVGCELEMDPQCGRIHQCLCTHSVSYIVINIGIIIDYQCYTGTTWDSSFCPDPKSCAKNCAIDGVDTNDMKNTYGVTSDGDKLRLNFVTQGQCSKNVGSRLLSFSALCRLLKTAAV